MSIFRIDTITFLFIIFKHCCIYFNISKAPLGAAFSPHQVLKKPAKCFENTRQKVHGNHSITILILFKMRLKQNYPLRVAKTTNTCTELYQSFILYTGSYMFRQRSAIIREILGFVWVTWNADRIGGISYNVYLCGLCAHRPHKRTLYDVPPIRSTFQVTQTDPRSSLMMADLCRNM
jgi:hypothetical protein